MARVWTAGRIGLATWTSAVALAVFPSQAQADCAPDPVANGGTVICVALDDDGFASASDDITVNVTAGATVQTPDVAFDLTGDRVTFNNDVFVLGTVNIVSSGELDIFVSDSGQIQTPNDTQPGLNIVGDTGSDITVDGFILTLGADSPALSVTQNVDTLLGDPDDIRTTGIIQTIGDNSNAVTIIRDGAQYTNSGQIQTNGTNAAAVFLERPATAVSGIDFTNTATGTILTTGVGSDGVVLNGDGTTLDNAGEIFSTLGISVLGDAGAQTVTNTGLIEGTVNLGGGDDTVIAGNGGEFTGLLDGGADTDLLSINNTDDALFDDIAGFETVNKNGAGVVTINGTSGIDDLNILNGSMIIGGGVDGNVTVSEGTNLTIADEIGGNANIEGTFTPLPDDTDFQIGGNLVLESTSILGISFSEEDTSSISVSGDATLNNGDVVVVPIDAPIGQFTFDFLTVDGQLTGNFNEEIITPNFEIVDIAIDEATDIATIQVNTNIGFGVSLSEQAQQAAAFLQQFVDNGNGNVSTLSLIRDLLLLDPETELEAALLAILDPSVYTAFVGMSIDQNLTVADIVRDRAQTKVGERGPFFGWAAPFGSLQKTNGEGLIGTWDRDTTIKGVISGGGMNFADQAAFGFFVGTSSYDQEFTNAGALTEGDSLIFGSFITGRIGPVMITGIASYDQSDLKTTRPVIDVDQPAIGNYEAESYMGSASLSVSLGEKNFIAVEPRVQASFISVSRGTVNEQGSETDLFLGEQSRDALYVDGGIKILPGEKAGLGRVKPYLVGGWRQDVIYDDDNSTGVLLENETESFQAAGIVPDENHGYVGVGLNAKVNKVINVDFEYRGEFGDTATRHVLTGNVFVKF